MLIKNVINWAINACPHAEPSNSRPIRLTSDGLMLSQRRNIYEYFLTDYISEDLYIIMHVLWF